ncbi:hypothetical protein [Agrococcus sp. KRD186]|jgi:hypothetical protein|uniref:hypothetical protein n=1 Tax=Agrococcus sp. KRD186 TaxID=2729730 RepID=UPI0019D036F9|nr:hypothetical protein [Agrococcus sp. KRD186]
MDISEAILLKLKHYPGPNEADFQSKHPSEAAQAAVRAILDEAMRIQIESGSKTLIEIGDEVSGVMGERHQGLLADALDELANYFTYLVK